LACTSLYVTRVSTTRFPLTIPEITLCGQPLLQAYNTNHSARPGLCLCFFSCCLLFFGLFDFFIPGLVGAGHVFFIADQGHVHLLQGLLADLAFFHQFPAGFL